MFGLRFRDAATERVVGAELEVVVHRANGVGRAVRAVPTPSGTYVAQRLPGLVPYERAEEGAPASDVPLRGETYDVHVRDRRDRFVPIRLRVDLPYEPDVQQGGLYPVIETPEDADSPDPDPACYLFSTVQRSVTAGMSVVYADLVVERDGALTPAAHAVLEVEVESENGGTNGPRLYYGLADEQGRVAVAFPTPPVPLEELRTPPGEGTGNGGTGNGGGPETTNGGRGGGRGRGGGSEAAEGDPSPGNASTANGPSSASARPLSARQWAVTVRVRYRADLPVPEGPGAARPLLSDVLQQPDGTLFTDASTSATGLDDTLAYGTPLVLATDGLPGDRTALRIAPGTP